MRRETEIVGIAAHSHTADWGSNKEGRVPDGDAIRAFVQDYETARGAPFNREERVSIFANAVYAIAYGARCGHSYDPKKADWPDTTFTGVLRKDGEGLLREAQL